VIEFDTPFNLLQKQQSVFHSIVKRTGPVESERLREIATTVDQLKFGTRLYKCAVNTMIPMKLTKSMLSTIIV